MDTIEFLPWGEIPDNRKRVRCNTCGADNDPYCCYDPDHEALVLSSSWVKGAPDQWVPWMHPDSWPQVAS